MCILRYSKGRDGHGWNGIHLIIVLLEQGSLATTKQIDCQCVYKLKYEIKQGRIIIIMICPKGIVEDWERGNS